MYDIVSVGETLIDFTPFKPSPGKYPVFEQNPGGAPANLAAAAARMGARTAFIGKVGADQFGAFLARVLAQCNVETRGLVRTEGCQTPLAFVHLDDDGQREFNFYRNADQLLREDEVDWALVENARVVHISSLAFCGDVTARTTEKIVVRAKAAGALLTYDANWRPMLWKDPAEGKRLLAAGNGFADIIKASEEELYYITGEEKEENGARILLSGGVKMVLVTKGGAGSAVYTRNTRAASPALGGVRPVDTTGAGDICFGTFLAHMLRQKKGFLDMDGEELAALLRTANTAAGLSVTKRGGISSIPAATEVEAFLTTHPRCEA